MMPNAYAVSTAPHLLQAAERPREEARTRVGNNSTGIRKVVAVGPKLRTSWDKANNVMRPPLLAVLLTPSHVAYMTAVVRKE